MKCNASHSALFRRNTAGLTIVEVVLAMGILAMGLAAVIGIFTAAADLGVSARQRAEAAAALDFLATELSERLFPLEEDGSVGLPAVVVREPVPGFERLTYSVDPIPAPDAPAPGLPLLYRVDITIHWSEQGRERALRHRALLPAAVTLGDRLRRELFGIPPIETSALPESIDQTQSSSRTQ